MKKLILILIFLFPSLCFGAIAVRQHATNRISTSGTTVPMTITASLSGSVIAVTCVNANTRTVSSVTDDKGNTYVHATNSDGSQSSGALDIDSWYSITTVSGAVTVTCNYSGVAATDTRTGYVWEVTGFVSAVYDVGGNSSPGTGVGTTDSGPSLTMTGTTGFSWGGARSGSSISASPLSGNEYNAGGDSSGDFTGGSLSLLYVASGTHQAQWLDGGSGSQFIASIGSLKESGGAGPARQPLRWIIKALRIMLRGLRIQIK